MELSISSNGGIKLYNNLLNISESEPHYLKHQMKHPADILTSAVDKISRAYSIFIASMDDHEIDIDKKKEKSIFDYALALDSFYDQLLLVIKSLSPTGKNDNKDVTIWLRENNPESYNKFKDGTSKAHSQIRKISNKIKHDSIEVNYITITNHKAKEIKGFYFSSIIGANELRGPDLDIHVDYKDSKTAFSYDYFIRHTAGYVATCLYHLNKIFFAGKKSKPNEFKALYNFFNDCSSAGNSLFPNEHKLDLASINIEPNSIKIKYPTKEKKEQHGDYLMNIQPLFKFNQRTNSSNENIPYFRLKS